jgi:hypothetical protein
MTLLGGLAVVNGVFTLYLRGIYCILWEIDGYYGCFAGRGDLRAP